jgi:hypothetical protein
LQTGVHALAALQDRLYAQNRWAVLLIFQGMDAAVLLTLYVALTAAYPDSAWKTLRHQLCRK